MDVSISESVGFECPNNADDVTAVQAALKEAARLTLDPRIDPGAVDGVCGVGTEGAIERFQRRLGTRRPDVKIDPGGNTLKRLNALLAIDSVNMTFPFTSASAFSFFGMNAGMRAFGSRRYRRDGGPRAHAAVDLYFPDFTDVLALADGIVTRGPRPFYRATFAVEIDHGPFIGRYGEIAPENTWPVEEGYEVQRGQKIGRVGILTNSDGSRMVKWMMLHLELYDKTQTGRLSRAVGTSARSETGVPFFRRRDLIDPSGFIVRAPLP